MPPHPSPLTPHATAERARLRWLCRRGMKELDVLLERFFNAGYDDLDTCGRAALRGLLEQEDPSLYGYLIGRDTPADPDQAAVARLIREYRPQA